MDVYIKKIEEQEVKDRLGELEDIAQLIKSSFVDKDELVDLLVTSVIAQEHLLVVGPPGTAKSAVVKLFAELCTDRKETPSSYFEYLLTRFTEPNEIFGPVNIAGFKSGKGLARDTANMLPEANIAFLDEVFKANSAILNALLTLLNERVFYNAGAHQPVGLINVVGATNTVPDDQELVALYDRFLLRFYTGNVAEARFVDLFRSGWEYEKTRIASGYGVRRNNLSSIADLKALYAEIGNVDLSRIVEPYREVVRRIRAEGIQLSDRRVVKLLKLIAASALVDGRMTATPADFWILRHVWSDPDQIANLGNIVQPYIEEHQTSKTREITAERSLFDISAELIRLTAQVDTLKTDIDYLDHLQQIGRLRDELQLHSTGLDGSAKSKELMERNRLLEDIETLIDRLMGNMGNQL